MVGIGRGAIKANGETDTSTGFAYGAGIQFTPIAANALHVFPYKLSSKE